MTDTMWPLNDIAGATELGEAHDVSAACINQWAKRYPDFPAPLLNLPSGRLYSRKQVAAWRTAHVERTRRTEPAA